MLQIRAKSLESFWLWPCAAREVFDMTCCWYACGRKRTDGVLAFLRHLDLERFCSLGVRVSEACEMARAESI